MTETLRADLSPLPQAAIQLLERYARGRGDGAVRLWDAATGEAIGLLVDGVGETRPSTPWFDADRDTMWVASSGRLVELSLDPARWIEKACQFVGRDLTQDERDRYIPGDESPQSACP